ncbi:hypothetical protein DXG01_001084 [Tephrocybe rancida]|nr:hypothetical protein DXG01_001084 [Tephrocybe rancida]
MAASTRKTAAADCATVKNGASTTPGKNSASTATPPPSCQAAVKVAGVRKRVAASPPPARRAPAAKKSKGHVCKAPATIDPNEDSDEDEMPFKPFGRRPVFDEDDEPEDEPESEDDFEEKDEQDYDDGLGQLDTETLRKTLMAERAQWAPKRAPKPSQCKDNEEEDAILPQPEVNDHDVNNDLDDDVSDHGQHTKPSKRALACQAEVPAWADNHRETDNKDSSADEDMLATRGYAQTAARAIEISVNAGWEPAAHYVPIQNGARNISITAQPPILKALIKIAICKATSDAMFDTAYPKVEMIPDYHHQIILDAAKSLDADALLYRLQRDTVLVDHISRLLGAQITQPKIENAYNLGDDVEVEEHRKIVHNLIKNGTYIYCHLGPKKTLIARTKPYQEPAIISALKEYFFSGSCRSLASKHASRFTSRIKEGPASLELELPLPMVCMIATGIHASIDDWSTGYQKKTDFNSEVYEDVYHGHELFLNNIRAGKAGAYHRLMADLYHLVFGEKGSHSATTIANNAMAVLDLDGMDE